MSKEQEASANLDSQTFQMTVPAGTQVQPGDALIVRETQWTAEGLRVSVVPERTIRETIEKVYVRS